MNQIRIFADSEALARAAADTVADLAAQSITLQSRFSIALSGGSTPQKLHTLLATEPLSSNIDWVHVHVFWGDERCVPPDDADSNYGAAKEVLLDHVPLPSENIHRIKGELNPKEAADEYEQVLHNHFTGDLPYLDLVLLGMGDDGHTASLFPHTSALNENRKWVVDNYVPSKQVTRITLTPLAINAARNILFLVSGSNKAERVHQVLKGVYNPLELPSQFIKPIKGNLFWMLDAAAGALL
jgi:6-phosphogluconolactonase